MSVSETLLRHCVTEKSLNAEVIQDIRHGYKDENQKTYASTNIDFKKKDYRDGYNYLYCTSHANLVMKEWSYFWPAVSNAWLTTIIMDKTIQLCLIGGGPGTDAFGFYSFLLRMMKNLNPLPNLKVKVLDKFIEWKETSDELVAAVNHPRLTDCKDPLSKMEYQMFNFFEFKPQDCVPIQEADILSMVKFLSVVCQDKRKCEDQLWQIFSHMKEGALFFFVENSGGGYSKIFRKVARLYGLKLLKQHNNHTESVSPPCKKLMKMTSIAKGCEPQPQTKIIASLWTKPEKDIEELLEKDIEELLEKDIEELLEKDIEDLLENDIEELLDNECAPVA